MSKLNKEELYKNWFSCQEYNNLERLQELIDMGVDVNYKDSANLTALFYSISYNKINNVEFLLKKGADPNIMAGSGSIIVSEGETPFLFACRRGHFDIVQLLHKYKANIHVADKDGITALMSSCYWGHLKIVKYLIQNKVDVNEQDVNGETALMKAVQNGRIMLVSFLLFCGVDLSLKNNYGFTVMQIPTTKLIKDHLNSWMKEDVI